MICKECHKQYTPIHKPIEPMFYGFCSKCGMKNSYLHVLNGYFKGVAASIFSIIFVLFNSVYGWAVLIINICGLLFSSLILYIIVKNIKPKYYFSPKQYKSTIKLIHLFGIFIGILSVVFWMFISHWFVKL